MKTVKEFLKSTILRDKESLLSIISYSVRKGIISPIEERLISNCLSARNTPLYQAMIDKAQTATVTENASIKDILAIYHEYKHSRYPVLTESGEVIGIILMKDYIAIMQENHDSKSIKNIMRTAPFAPDTKPVLSLLQEMQQTHQHMSIVLDEYGQFQGIVTIEDLLEQIVGQIEDEHDTQHPEYIRQLNEHEHLISGLTPVEQFNQYFNLQFDINEFDTISGILSKSFGYIPKKGDEITIEGLTFRIHSASATSIKKINIKQSPAQ